LIALPGEKLSRAAAARMAAPVGIVAPSLDEDDEDEGPRDALEALGAAEGGIEVLRETDDGGDQEARRRRRRRGGRGRGRGRGMEEGAPGTEVRAAGREPMAPSGGFGGPVDDVPAAPRAPRAAAFGSVWDSQIGVNRTPAPLASLSSDDEFDDEPAIPEYLIAERRGNRGSGARGGGGRGGYAAAVDRERYGRGGSGGINRYPVPGPGRPLRPAPAVVVRAKAVGTVVVTAAHATAAATAAAATDRPARIGRSVARRARVSSGARSLRSSRPCCAPSSRPGTPDRRPDRATRVRVNGR
jgi:hypothetical protein